MKVSVMFGAGNIGRGFMGQFFFEAGYNTVFIDAQKRLVDDLNRSKSYPLLILDAKSKKKIQLTILNFRALHVDQAQEIAASIADADVVSSAVGVKNLIGIAPLVAEGLKLRCKMSGRPIDIYLCENMLDAAGNLKTFVSERLDPETAEWAEQSVGFVGTSVARMVPLPPEEFKRDNPLGIIADSYHKLAFDGKASRGMIPNIDGMYPVNNFKVEMEKKLFIYNLCHAACAYLGNLKRVSYVHETLQDPELKIIFNGALEESARAFLRLYPEDFRQSDFEAVRDDIHLRYGNPLIMDGIYRVGRDPVRKLGPNDRLVGSAHLCISQDIFPENIAKVCAAAFCYDNPKDESARTLQASIKKGGIEQVLKRISEVDPDSPLGNRIVFYYRDYVKRIHRSSGKG